MIIQVCGENCDHFHEIAEGELRRIYGLPPAERKEAFCEKAADVSVHSTSEVDAVLVMDGNEDGESWEELAEEMGWSSKGA